MPKEILSKVEKETVEAIKKGFQKSSGSSLGEIRRAARGIKEAPAAMTEAEKEFTGKSRRAPTEKQKTAERARREKEAQYLEQFKTKGFKTKEEILKELGEPKPESAKISPRVKPEREAMAEAKRAFQEREETMGLYENAPSTSSRQAPSQKYKSAEAPAPENIATLSPEEDLPGLEMHGAQHAPYMSPRKKPLAPPKKSWKNLWGLFG